MQLLFVLSVCINGSDVRYFRKSPDQIQEIINKNKVWLEKHDFDVYSIKTGITYLELHHCHGCFDLPGKCLIPSNILDLMRVLSGIYIKKFYDVEEVKGIPKNLLECIDCEIIYDKSVLENKCPSCFNKLNRITNK